MIVQPDFFDHWKIRQLAKLTGRPESPLWLQRLWGHCQTSKAYKFKGLPATALTAICCVPPDISPDKWRDILLECRLIEIDGATMTVHDWKKQNAKLLANWKNGKFGGRPKANPTQTHGFALGFPKKTDRSDRSDRSDENEGGSNPPPPSNASQLTNLNSPSTAAGETEAEWQARITREWPGVNIAEQLTKAQKKRAGDVERGWFERSWLPGVTPKVSRGVASIVSQEPENWRDILEGLYPDNLINREKRGWAGLPENIRNEVTSKTQQRRVA